MTAPRYQAGDIIGETTTEGGRLVKVLHVGEGAYFVRHLGGLGSFDGIPDMEPLETAWPFAGCEAATYLHERPEPEDLPELTTEDAVEAMQDMATDLYKAEDRLAFIAEMCDAADREQWQVTTEQVRAWTSYEGCANSTPDGASLAQSLGAAMAAMQPGAEPVFCNHENAVRSSHTTMQAGWGRKTVRTVSCPTCSARAESTEGEPVLTPWLLNAERCTEACTERHTNGPGCLMAPDWSKPTLTAEQLARLDQDGVDTKGCDCGHPGMGVAWHLGWCTWRKGQENHGPDSPASGSRR